jgi:hypothetical protein
MAKGKGRTTIFTNPLKSIKKRGEAIKKAGGGSGGKRLKYRTTIPKKKT